jgi:glycosyltransferase involved in cell wall biosynthesis
MPIAPRVSVVMTAYNGSRHLREAIESILRQTFRDFEFLIIDDASTDDTVAIVRGYDDPRIRLIENGTNLGISRTRNIGIENARGEYLAALDHDDVSLPERLEREVAFLDSRPDVVLVGTGAKLLEDGRLSDYYDPIPEPHLLHWALMTRCPLIHSSICMRTSVLRAHALEYRAQYPCAEDFDLYHQLARIGKLVCLPDRLTIYREHGANTGTLQGNLMSERGQAFLLEVYRELLGPGVAREDVERVWRIITYGIGASSREELLQLGQFLARLLDAFLSRSKLTASERDDVRRDAGRDWWKAVRRTARAHGARILGCYGAIPALGAFRVPSGDLAVTAILAALGPGLTGALRRGRAGLTSVP